MTLKVVAAPPLSESLRELSSATGGGPTPPVIWEPVL